jgi:hypothetical protein
LASSGFYIFPKWNGLLLTPNIFFGAKGLLLEVKGLLLKLVAKF